MRPFSDTLLKRSAKTTPAAYMRIWLGDPVMPG